MNTVVFHAIGDIRFEEVANPTIQEPTDAIVRHEAVPSMTGFPIGEAMNKNSTIRMGNCSHRREALPLIELVRTGAIDPTQILAPVEPLTGVIEACEAFDRREPGGVKVAFEAAA